MSQYLPYSEFKWVKNVDYFDVNSLSKNSLYGYILEVYLEYQMNYINSQWLSIPSRKIWNYLWHVVRLLQKHCWQIQHISWWCKKSVPSLGKKTNYTVHTWIYSYTYH